MPDTPPQRFHRVHTFEFEDAAWLPTSLRSSMTNVLVVACRLMGATDVIVTLAARALRNTTLNRLVDLGSGAGGVMPDVVKRLRRRDQTRDVQLLMTDLYPNSDALRRFDPADEPYLRYEPTPVDATTLASAPTGLRTMINCFHHMRPQQARQVLASAAESGCPLLIYELATSGPPFIVWCLLFPVAFPLVALSVWVFTPFVRPLTARQLLLTYVIPIIPILYAWDGLASLPRMYAPQDLETLLAGIDSPNYTWESGPAVSDSGRHVGTYVLGQPRGSPS